MTSSSEKIMKKNIIITFFVFSTFLILVLLGFWQLSRLQEKKIFLASMHENLVNEAVPVDFGSNQIYRKVKLFGKFLEEKDIYLFGRRSMTKEKDGYYLITPFQTIDNKIILIARGWFSALNKNKLFETNNNQFHEITGVILPSEKTQIFVPKNDIKNNIWFTLDLSIASKELGLVLQNFYLIQEGKDISNSDILLPLSIHHLANVRNDHLEYALTWFGLSIALMIIYFIHYRKHKFIPLSNR